MYLFATLVLVAVAVGAAVKFSKSAVATKVRSILAAAKPAKRDFTE